MKRLTSIFLVLAMLLTLTPMNIFAADADKTAFSDMKETDYYAQAATALEQLDILAGYPDGTFGAEKSITRAEMAAIVCRMIDKEADAEKAKGETAFEDVKGDHWASGYINIASKEGIINGDGNGKFRAEDDVKHEEAIKMVVCALGYGADIEVDPADWSKGYLEVADEKGISADLKGTKGKASTRGDVAVMSYNGLATESENSKIPATPVASKDAGEYKGTQKVKLTTATKDADIYYTTDGTTPTAKSTKYTKEISISKTSTLKAIAIKNGVVSKGVMSIEYTIKKVSSGGGGGSSRPTTYSLSFATTENGSVDASVAGSYVTNSVINLIATPNENYVFVKWESNNGGTFADDNSATTTFTMPANNVTITAVFAEKETVPAEIAELFGVDPDDYDTDNDGLSNYIEIYVTGTEPTLADSDEDGTLDSDEDFDEDGLTNKQEIDLGTDPSKADTDNDGLDDFTEVNSYSTDPINHDSDGDTLSDGDEILLGLNPLVQKTDGTTHDSERTFTQELSENNISEELLSIDNAAVPALTLTASGNINNDVIISATSSNDFSDSRAIVGEAVDVSGENISEGTISFTLQNDGVSLLSVDDTDETFNTNLICKYNADGSTEYLDTDYDSSTNTLSADINEEGTYFVMDVKNLFDELGLAMPTVADLSSLTDPEPVALMSIDEFGEEDNQNQNNNSNESTEEISLFSIEENAEDVNVVAASAETEKVTLMASSGAMAQADIVFIIDTTGSMSGAINNVKNNVKLFVDELKSRGISAGLALIDYQDITWDGYDSTRVHKNGSSNWFYDMDAYKEKIAALYADDGGDTPECAVDALETARLLDMRASAGKIFILVTDADYKVDNRYGIPSMAAEIELLKNAGVTCSVVCPSYEQSTYYNLYNDTNGIWANIYGDFNTELTALADRIGEEIVGDGYWIYLQGPVPVPVRLNAMPEEGSTEDTDEDGIPDIEELESATPSGEIDLDELITKVSRGAITDTDYGIVKMFKYKSSPVEKDTDFDGIADTEDVYPNNNSFTGKMNRFDKDDVPAYDLNNGKISFSVDYRWFFGNNYKYNSNISVLSSLYAADIYENKSDIANDSDVQIYVDGLLTDRHTPSALLEIFGLNDASVIPVGYTDNDRTEVALGHRCVEYNGEKKEIILIAVRGTNGTFEEWSSNFDVGADTSEYYSLTGYHSEWENKENHKGFDVTANRVMNAVSEYLNTAPTLDADAKKVYWITGHSRGAGIANIIGAYYEAEGKETFTYTFAAPTTTTSYNNCRSIFNIINEDDLIPTLPLENWHFKRYGTDKPVSVAAHSGSKTFWGKGGTYKGGAFKDLLDMNYNNNEKVDWLLGIFENIANGREDLYHFTYSDDTLELSGLNHSTEESAQKATNEKKGSKSIELQRLGKFEAIEGTNGFGKTVWKVGCYQTPAYFMQALAELAANKTIHEVASKYHDARNAFVVTYASGMDHPHWTETYYLIAKGKFSNAW